MKRDNDCALMPHDQSRIQAMINAQHSSPWDRGQQCCMFHSGYHVRVRGGGEGAPKTQSPRKIVMAIHYWGRGGGVMTCVIPGTFSNTRGPSRVEKST